MNDQKKKKSDAMLMLGFLGIIWAPQKTRKRSKSNVVEGRLDVLTAMCMDAVHKFGISALIRD